MKRVLSRIAVDFPTLKQHAFEGEVRCVAYQWFTKLAGNITHFRPVINTRVFDVFDIHRNLQDPAFFTCGIRSFRKRQTEQAIGRSCAKSERTGRCKKFAAADFTLVCGSSKLLDKPANGCVYGWGFTFTHIPPK